MTGRLRHPGLDVILPRVIVAVLTQHENANQEKVTSMTRKELRTMLSFIAKIRSEDSAETLMAGTSTRTISKTSTSKRVSSQNLRSSGELLRHTVATLAYRAEKVLREVPEEFAEFRAAAKCRTPLEILSHLGDLMEWAERLARGEYRWDPQPAGEWTDEVDRFFTRLKALDRALASPSSKAHGVDTIFQGPIADALTHVGQLSMLRGMFGAPVRPEAYARARIRVGRVGRAQPASRVEFDGDASRPRANTT